jgi:DNA polymerase I-like protein with 3'-5' exonuclease and polymerase domains
MTRLVFDIETNGLLDAVSKVHCICVYDVDTKEAHSYHGETLQSGLQALASADVLIGHNILGYDIPVLVKLHKFSHKALIRDTLLCARVIWSDVKEKDFAAWKAGKLPGDCIGIHSLKAWGYRLGCLKGTYGETSDWATFSPEMLSYCEQDVQVTAKLWERIESKQYSEQCLDLEHAFAAVIGRQERFGVTFNEPEALKLYQTLSLKRQSLRETLMRDIPGWTQETKTPAYYAILRNGQEVSQHDTKGQAEEAQKKAKLKPSEVEIVAGPNKVKAIPFNPSSRDHIAKLFTERYGWQPKGFTENGKPTIDDAVLGSLVFPEAKILAEYFMLEKRIGQLAEGDNAWLKLVKNGKIHGRINTNGAITGRCTHANPNMGQVPAVYSPFGKECRSLFGPPAGMTLVGADASGLELRCLAHYMASYDQGSYAKELLTGDIHTANQKAAGLPTRDNAKTFIYAFLYGAGDEKIGSIVGKGAKEGKALKEQFLAKTPALKSLLAGVQRAAKERGYLYGLDKRILPIRHQHAALNTLLQSAGAVAMKQALVLLDSSLQCSGMVPGADYEFLLNVHDEWQIATKPDHVETIKSQACRAITAAGEFFGFKCPLAGEAKAGANWAETH